MKQSFEIIIRNGNDEEIINKGVDSIDSVNAIINTLNKNKDMISKYSELSITLILQEDNNN